VKIKLDENLPERLVLELACLGHDVDTVHRERLAGEDESQIWRAAQTAGRFLITQDLDFSDARLYTPGTHAGVMVIRLTQPGRDILLARVAALFATETTDEWKGCLVIATDRKVRVRRSR